MPSESFHDVVLFLDQYKLGEQNKKQNAGL